MYLRQKFSKHAATLYLNQIFLALAHLLIALFLPIFFLERFGKIEYVIIFYIFYYGLYIFLAAPGAIISSKLTFKKAMILSTPFGVLYYLTFYFFDHNYLLFTVLMFLFLNVFRMLYWVPYHSDFAEFTNKNDRGKTLALFQSAFAFISIFVPLLSGFIITVYGFGTLFIIAMLVYMASIVPLIFIPKTFEAYSFTYKETWRVLFHKRERRVLLSYMADGAQDIVGIVIWPIFIWSIVDQSFEAVGLLATGIILVTIILRLFMGDWVDRFDKQKLLKFGSIFYAAGWIIKAFIQTAFHIFVTGSFHSISAIFMRTPFDTIRYEKAADLGHYVDEYTVLREMALAMGRALMLIVVLIAIQFIPLNIMFIFAALVSLVVNVI